MTGLRVRTLLLAAALLFVALGLSVASGGRSVWTSDRTSQHAALDESARAASTELRREAEGLLVAVTAIAARDDVLATLAAAPPPDGAAFETARDALDVDALVLAHGPEEAVAALGSELGGVVPEVLGSGVGVTRWLLVSGEPWLVATVPARAADGRAGVLIAARHMEAGRLSRLSSMLGATVTLGQAASSADALVGASELTMGAPFAVVLQRSPRGEESLFDRVVAAGRDLALVGGLATALLLFFLDRTVLRRLQSFSALADRIRTGGEPGLRLPVAGKDELDSLAGSLNALLEKVDSTHNQLRHDALHDPLTGLANRALLYDRLDMALARRARSPVPAVALLFLDLDRLKVLNDRLGHAAGDHFLAELGRRLASCVRPGDTVARLGGDEFGIVLLDIADPKVALARADAVLELVRAPIPYRGGVYHVTASIGVALASSQHVPAQLVREADMAMYEAKAGGRDRASTYDSVLQGRLAERVAIENALRQALADGEVEICLQPIVAARDGILIGYEALARWTHPTLGVVSPSHFVAIAEESQLIVSVDRYVLERALSAIGRLRKGGRPLTICVNHASRTVDAPDFVEWVHEALIHFEIPPAALVIELSETQLSRNEERWLPRIRALSDKGVRFAIEDFGMGVSSLARLHHLPVALVKLDREFVRALGSSDEPITRAVMGMAHELGRTVIAEGVETQAERDRLVELGCTLVQGFLVGRPEAEAVHLTRLGLGPSTTIPDA